MLYELKNQNGLPVLFMGGVEIYGTGINTTDEAKNWISMVIKDDALDKFMLDYETSGYASFEQLPIPRAELRTEFDSPEQKARYIAGVELILAALRK